MSNRKTLYLIDGSSYIFRAFFAIKHNLANSKGFPTNALYGFTNMLMKVVRNEEPDYLAVVFDSKEKTFRHEMYPEYKANRSAPPEDLKEQFPMFEPLVEAFNIASLRQDGFEADDIIGTLAKQGEEHGLDVVIVSGDKDMMQLVTDHTCMLDTMKDKRIGIEEVKEKFGVSPEQVIEVMGLMGDSSDNIPGVAGVGPKTATELIKQFGSIQGVYEGLEDITKKKLKEKLETYKENALLSKKLVTIDTAMSLDKTIEDLKCQEPDTEKLREIFSELEFKNLLDGLGDASSQKAQAEETSAVDSNYELVLEKKQLDTWIKAIKKAGEFAVDLETTSKRPVHAEMVGISLAVEPHSACYIPVSHRYLGVPEQLDKKEVLAALKPLLEDAKLKKFGHNIKYDLIVFKNEGIDLKGIAFDSMLAAYVLDPSQRNYSMDTLALEMLQRKTISYSEVAGKGVKEIGFDEVELEPATQYAAEDADITLQLTRLLEPRLKDETLELYNTMELPLIDVLADMERTGICLDKKHLSKLSKSIQSEIEKLEKEIHALAGEPFNINSPKQLSVILFEKLELRVIKKTKSGYSTDVKVLEELAQDHALPEKILSYRQMSKLKSTYVDALPTEVFKKTGRVHTSYNQTVAATGRLSSSDPNLQNIPIRTAMGKDIRRAFVADEGKELFAADYSQIELRILAHLSEDEALISAFKKGEDIHSRTAAEIFGSNIEDVDEDARRMAKAVNFGIVYGLSAFGLSRQLKISPKDAKEFIDQYFDLYKNVKVFMESTIEDARQRGYTVTLMNRRRYLPDLHSKNRQVRESTERVAINSPVQGSAADLIKMAMLRLFASFNKQKLKSKMILQVHDELVFECVKAEKQKVQSMVIEEMEGVFPLKVPLVVDHAWGKNWVEAK